LIYLAWTIKNTTPVWAQGIRDTLHGSVPSLALNRPSPTMSLQPRSVP